MTDKQTKQHNLGEISKRVGCTNNPNAFYSKLQCWHFIKNKKNIYTLLSKGTGYKYSAHVQHQCNGNGNGNLECAEYYLCVCVCICLKMSNVLRQHQH